MLIGKTRQGVISAIFFLELRGEFLRGGGMYFWNKPSLLHDQLHTTIAFDNIKARLPGPPFCQRPL